MGLDAALGTAVGSGASCRFEPSSDPLPGSPGTEVASGNDVASGIAVGAGTAVAVGSGASVTAGATVRLSLAGEAETVPSPSASFADMGSDPDVKRNTRTAAITAVSPIVPMAIRLVVLRPSGALETLMIYTFGGPAVAGSLASR